MRFLFFRKNGISTSFYSIKWKVSIAVLLIENGGEYANMKWRIRMKILGWCKYQALTFRGVPVGL